MADKPKVAIMWLGGCGGCDEAVVDLNENVLKVAAAVDFVLWPVALDFKYHHIEAMKDGEITLSIINGSVRNSELEEFAKVLRKKSQLVLAFGACACFGGTPGLANFRSREDIFQWVYKDAPTVNNPKGNYPQTTTKIDGKELTLPYLFDDVRTLNQVIDVDYYLPGCPPPANLILEAVSAVLEGRLPPKGSTLAPERALCDVCDEKPDQAGQFDHLRGKEDTRDRSRSREVFSGPGRDLLRTGDPGGMRRGVPEHQYALQGLLRPG